MCLYPKLIKNPKYKANKKNKGIIPIITDERVKYVPIGCQNCMECTKQKAREWQVRLLEEIRYNNTGKFITFTFNNATIAKLSEHENIKNLQGYERDNAIATLATRHFLERWRKTYKKSLRHWLVTELGHNGTENIHIHGIVWTTETIDKVEQHWQWIDQQTKIKYGGYVWTGRKAIQKHGYLQRCTYINYVNEKTIGYITKYVTKQDKDHTQYKPRILTSAGIGSNYTTTYNAKNNAYQGKQTKEVYITRTGHKLALPIYWRNKIYTEQEREQLWLHRLDKQERWVCGERVSIKNGETAYYKILQFYQKRNTELGYGNDTKDWNKKQYEEQRRNIMHQKRTEKYKRKTIIKQNDEQQSITIGNSKWIITNQGIRAA